MRGRGRGVGLQECFFYTVHYCTINIIQFSDFIQSVQNSSKKKWSKYVAFRHLSSTLSKRSYYGPLGTDMYTFGTNLFHCYTNMYLLGTNMLFLGANVYFLKRYCPSDKRVHVLTRVYFYYFYLICLPLIKQVKHHHKLKK